MCCLCSDSHSDTNGSSTVKTLTGSSSSSSTSSSSPTSSVSTPARPVSLSAPITDDVFAQRFLRPLHLQFVLSLDKHTDSFEYCATEHLKMSAVYWALMTLDLNHSLHLMDRAAVIRWVQQCRHTSGGYGGNISHDAHLLYTLSAVQVLYILDAEDEIDRAAVAGYVSGLQQPDGSFWGDEWGEVDTRFSYCALNCLALLGELGRVDVARAMEFVGKCRNFDGGFGAVPGAESHSGQSQLAASVSGLSTSQRSRAV